MLKKAIYSGTFDPITNGHLNIIKRALKIFDEVVVAVAKSSGKNPMFNFKDRVKFLKEATKSLDKVSVKSFDTLLVDFLKQESSFVVVRGLRAVSDFEYELQIGYANSSLYSEMETIYLASDLNNAFVSSSIVRSILNHNGKISHLVPKEVDKMIKKGKYKNVLSS